MAKFTRELDELVANKIITPEVASDIRRYYDKPTENRNLLVIAFGIIGALLIGMGIVLIIAHNWDELSIPVKLVIGLAPLLIAQVAAGFIIIKPIDSQAWRESVAVLLIFAVATAISIVSQVYNISGNFGKFLMVWSVLSLPVMYLLKSRIASLIYWCIVIWFCFDHGFNYYSEKMPIHYGWLLAVVAVPFYLNLLKNNRESNSASFHNWLIAIAVVVLISVGSGDPVFLIGEFLTLFSIFLLLGQLPVFADRKLLNNAWLIGGSAGIISILLFLTFEWVDAYPDKMWVNLSLFIWVFLFLIASALLYIVGTKNGFRNVLSKSYTFIIYIPLFLIGFSLSWLSIVLTNVLLLALGVYTIREGAMSGKLWKMNYGLLILSVLIACRFFDTDIAFVVRGLLFVAIGAGFFGMNYYMIRKRKISS